MNFALDLIQKIPAGWPRIVLLVAVAAGYFLFPSIYRKLNRRRREKEEIERLTRYLQAKKLLLETMALEKEKNLSAFVFPGEQKLLEDLEKASSAHEKFKEKIPYLRRLKFSLLGALAFFLIASLFAFLRSENTGSAFDTATFFLKNLGLSAACGFLASLIPLGNALTSFIYGITMPLALALLFLVITR